MWFRGTIKPEAPGILTYIDVKDTRRTCRRDFSPMVGACRPPFDHRALQLEDEVGT